MDTSDPTITCKNDDDCAGLVSTASCLKQADCPGTKCNGVTCATRTIFQRYGKISCLDQSIEKHDGRIRPVFHAPQ